MVHSAFVERLCPRFIYIYIYISVNFGDWLIGPSLLEIFGPSHELRTPVGYLNWLALSLGFFPLLHSIPLNQILESSVSVLSHHFISRFKARPDIKLLDNLI